MYSISEVSKMSGISTRTLRYYDEIDLFSPDHYSDNGYRQYSSEQLTRLQIILFYKELDFSLNEIKKMLAQSDISMHLSYQRKKLEEQSIRIQRLLELIDDTLKDYKGEFKMTDKVKFEAFKSKQLYDNEKNYGEELYSKYDKQTLDMSFKHFKGLSQGTYQLAVEAESEMFKLLDQMLKDRSNDVNSKTAYQIFNYHKQWLETMSGMYSNEYHRQLAEMYVNDERFAHYYNSRTVNDSVSLLNRIILHYAK